MGQPTIKIVLDEVFKTNFSIFDDYLQDARLDQVKKLNYIETIAHQLEKNLSGVNLCDILKNNNNIILATEAEINEALIKFDREEYFGRSEPEIEIEELTDEQKEAINKGFKRQIEQKKRNIERNINDCVNNATEHLRHHNAELEKASNLRLELMSITQVDSTPMVDAIEEVLKNPKFKLLGFNETYVSFMVREDIILTHKNPRAGIDRRCNLGKLKIIVMIDGSNGYSVEGHENNVMVRDYCHPHISSSGDICFGNMSELFQEARDNLDINGALEIIHSILVNYNDSDPYINLSDFVRQSKQVQPDGTNLRTQRSSIRSSGESRGQYHECPECGTENRIEFNAEGESDYMEHVCESCDYEYEYEYDYDAE